MSTDSAAYQKDLAGVVEFMLNQPDMIEEVLASHVPDHNGDCADCSGYRCVPWPCLHSLCAAQGKAIRDSRRM